MNFICALHGDANTFGMNSKPSTVKAQRMALSDSSLPADHKTFTYQFHKQLQFYSNHFQFKPSIGLNLYSSHNFMTFKHSVVCFIKPQTADKTKC